MRELSTDIEIAAPAARVWRHLTDFAAYPEWNPFIRRVEGALRPRARLRVYIQPPGGRGMEFGPTGARVRAGARAALARAARLVGWGASKGPPSPDARQRAVTLLDIRPRSSERPSMTVRPDSKEGPALGDAEGELDVRRVVREC